MKAPVLQRLCMRDMVVSGTNYFHLMFGSLRNLTHLDLSNCVHREGMSNFDWLSKYFGAPESHLYYLVLHNVPELTQDAITNNVCKLTKLRHLDISRLVYTFQFGILLPYTKFFLISNWIFNSGSKLLIIFLN